MADDSEQVGQDEIEALLKQSQASGDAPVEKPAEKPAADDVSLGQDDIEAMMQQAAGGTPPPAEDASLGQDDIEAMMQQASGGSAPPASQPSQASPPPAAKPAAVTQPVAPVVEQNDIDVLLNQAQAALASIDQPTAQLPEGVRSFKLEDFSGTPASTEAATLDLMRDVQLDVKIELGRTHMHLEEILKLQRGAVVPLDKLAGDPVDIFVNGRLIARGEVLVLNDNFCVRVAELIVGESACA